MAKDRKIDVTVSIRAKGGDDFSWNHTEEFKGMSEIRLLRFQEAIMAGLLKANQDEQAAAAAGGLVG